MKAYISPQLPPKISLRHDWTQDLSSKVDRHPQEVVRQSRGEIQHSTFSQLTQPVPNPICDRSGQPDNKHEVFVDEGETSWSQEIKEKSSHEELCSADQSGQPDITPSVSRAQTNLSEKSELSKLTIDQGNLINMKSHYKMPLKYIVRLRRSTPTMS